ncbi:MAG: rRNA maturation RNase YbeY [Desulfarculaceae bacterium]|nr:rRNA maturation RNase YbeY [Desulfarculaceae bacterium]MCF8073534.1 rRNA maturation RNase YbeY [Desulfarculaceae bacterium]MCF8103056.1 rRNA maturation RNase YbeY [Desulfarculaceae bacterium]MCF8115750.1 rRNA maturation RNase YbeY [Desulfarculaceae bacterium]
MPVLLDMDDGLALDARAIAARTQRVLAALELAPEAELSLVICGDEEIAALNRQWLGREGPTNVISFAQGEGEGADLTPELLGDVVVSAPYAAREAADNGLDPDQHLMRLIIHGILHLLGHEHEQGGEPARLMEQKTEELLAASAA